MATTLQATPQPLSEPNTSTPPSSTAQMSTQPSTSSVIKKTENGTTRRPSQVSSNSKHAKRHGNQPILVWLQRKIGGTKHSVKKQQTNGLANSTNTPARGGPKSSDLTLHSDSVGGTLKASRRTSAHKVLNPYSSCTDILIH